MGGSDSTSLVSFGLLTDVEMVSKGKADVSMLLESFLMQEYLCVLNCFSRKCLRFNMTRLFYMLIALQPRQKVL